jgi:hypothetical protein
MKTTELQLREGKPTIEDMAYDLAEEMERDMKPSEVIEMLIHGVVGIMENPEIEIRDDWKEYCNK